MAAWLCYSDTVKSLSYTPTHIKSSEWMGVLVLVLQSLVLSTNGSALANSQTESAATRCAKHVEDLFPLITIVTDELDLARARIRQVEHAVIIPLKSPHGDIQAVRWVARDVPSALEHIQLLRSGKISAVNVTPFINSPYEMYVARGVTREAVAECHKEEILKLFGTCSECDVVEWLTLTP